MAKVIAGALFAIVASSYFLSVAAVEVLQNASDVIPITRQGRGGFSGGKGGVVVIPSGEARILPKIYLTAGVATAAKVQNSGGGAGGGGWGNGGGGGGGLGGGGWGQGVGGGGGGMGGGGWGQGGGGGGIGGGGWGQGGGMGGGGWGQGGGMGGGGWGQGGGGGMGGWGGGGMGGGWGGGGMGWGGGGGGGWPQLCEDKKAAKAKAKAQKKQNKAIAKAMKKALKANKKGGGGGWGGGDGGGGGGGWKRGGGGGPSGGGGWGSGGGWRAEENTLKMFDSDNKLDEENSSEEIWPNSPPPRTSRIEDSSNKYDMMESFPLLLTVDPLKPPSSSSGNREEQVVINSRIPSAIFAQNNAISKEKNEGSSAKTSASTSFPDTLKFKLNCPDPTAPDLCYYTMSI